MAKAKGNKYHWTGDYARNINGEDVPPGDFITIDDGDISDETQELIDIGVLIPSDSTPSSGGTHSSSASSASTDDA